MLCLFCSGTELRSQLANLSCDQSWYYTTYGITSFVFNGTTVTSGVDWPGVAATVGTANTNMSQTFNAVPGQTCSYSINSQLSYYNQFGLYIDWNNNGSFWMPRNTFAIKLATMPAPTPVPLLYQPMLAQVQNACA